MEPILSKRDRHGAQRSTAALLPPRHMLELLTDPGALLERLERLERVERGQRVERLERVERGR